MEELEKLREEIDEIDKGLTLLFERRMEIAERIGELKRNKGMQVYDGNREREVILKNCGYLKDKRFSGYLEEFFLKLMDLSKRVQRG